jgi:hypothetical protein
MRMLLPFGAILAASLGLASSSAFAASAIQKECSQKYQAAKAANTLNGMKYNDYYKQCAAAAKAGGTTPAATPAATPAPAPAPAAPAPAPTTTAAKPAPMPAPTATSGNAVFPTAVSASFSNLSAGKARMQTCLAQYKANKANNGNGGLKWIEKGGGYYSECNKRLKG